MVTLVVELGITIPCQLYPNKVITVDETGNDSAVEIQSWRVRIKLAVALRLVKYLETAMVFGTVDMHMHC